MKKKIVSVLLCASLVATMVVGCGSKSSSDNDESSASSSSDAEKESFLDANGDGVIEVGGGAVVSGFLQYNSEGDLEGYDYDVWQEIGKRTGYEINYNIMERDSMWPLLESGKLDSVGEQVSVTEERQEKYEFTEPYGYNYYCLLAAADNEELQTMDDLKSGMTIACETNSSDEVIVKSVNEEYGIELQPTYFDGMSVEEVALGRCDLWPRAETSCLITIQEVDNLKILGRTKEIDISAYPFMKNDQGKALCEVVTEAIKEMREDGTLTKLSEKWFDLDISQKPTEE